jgi:hypothetical protein
MTGLTTDLISTACRHFFDLAYPLGEQTVPEKRRLYAHLPPGEELADYLVEHPFPSASFQTFSDADGTFRGYAFRLGCADFPHLKLKVHWMQDQNQKLWVFSVDTHDAFSRDRMRPPPDHPDAERWTRLQHANAELKVRIERALEESGLLTFNAVLRQGLSRPPAAPF